MALAGLQPHEISALEMHGTGTPLGDPIEVGAAVAILGKGAIPLRFTGAKSRLGHSEPVAGTVGIIQAVAQLSNLKSNAIMHLRQLNPLASTLLSSQLGSGGRKYRFLPRQDCAGLLDVEDSNRQPAGGVSAFAFQGTNAHAIMCPPPDITASVSATADIPWARQRNWFAPPPHAFLNRASAARATVSLQCALHGAALAYINDHRVNNVILFPAAAMLEAAFAAGLLLPQAQRVPALAKTVIPAPLVLEGGPSGAVLSTDIDAVKGSVRLCSTARGLANQRTHLIGEYWHPSPMADLSSKALTSPSQRVLIRKGPSRLQAAVAVANIEQAVRFPANQYCVHPAMIDNATQAGSALNAGKPTITRVPVGMELYYVPRSMRGLLHHSCGAAASIDSVSEHGTVRCSYHLTPLPAGADGLQVNGMLFKPMGSGPFQNPAEATTAGANAQESQPSLQNELFEVQWQVEAPMPMPRRPSPITKDLVWLLDNNNAHSIKASRGQTAIHAAQCSLQLLQQSVGSRGRTDVSLQTIHSLGTPKLSMAAGAAVGLLRVAAQEHASHGYSHQLLDARGAIDTAHNAALRSDLFGRAASSGVVGGPVMVKTPPQKPNSSGSLPLDTCYIIAGGLGDIGRITGLYLSQWEVVPQIWLLGRSGRSAEPMPLLSIGEYATCFHAGSCDVSMAADMDGIIAQIHSSAPTVTATFHAGATLRDGLLLNQTAQALREVYAPKVDGTLRTLAVTALMPVQVSVLFSSLSALLGTRGQSNYAAANMALDSIAQHQAALGNSWTSVMWGPWATGVALHDTRVLQRFKKAGLGIIPAAEGMQLMQNLLAARRPSLVAASISWNKLFQGHRRVPAIFADLASNAPPLELALAIKRAISAASMKHIMSSTSMSTAQASESEEKTSREAALISIVSQAVQSLVGAAVDADQPLMEAGLDSLGEA